MPIDRMNFVKKQIHLNMNIFSYYKCSIDNKLITILYINALYMINYNITIYWNRKFIHE